MDTLKRISDQYLDGIITTSEFWDMFFYHVGQNMNGVDQAAVALLVAEDFATEDVK